MPRLPAAVTDAGTLEVRKISQKLQALAACEVAWGTVEDQVDYVKTKLPKVVPAVSVGDFKRVAPRLAAMLVREKMLFSDDNIAAAYERYLIEVREAAERQKRRAPNSVVVRDLIHALGGFHIRPDDLDMAAGLIAFEIERRGSEPSGEAVSAVMSDFRVRYPKFFFTDEERAAMKGMK